MNWNDPSPEDINAAITYLDSVAREDYDDPAEWFDQASQRLILQLFVVRDLLTHEKWDRAVDGLLMARDMLTRVATSAVAQMSRDEVLTAVKNKLEILTQHPMAIVGDFNGLVGFRYDHPTVPDTYVEPPAS